jgi:hypothetical protein
VSSGPTATFRHSAPPSFFIYAFTSREQAESVPAEWIAMLAKTPEDPKPRVAVNESQPQHVGGTGGP